MNRSGHRGGLYAAGILNTMRAVITLATDFGLRDPYVGIVKGVIAGIAPDARVIDITHDIPPQDVPAAAFAISSAYRFFPIGTIHVAVVDPGVGTSRRAVAMELGGYRFVFPDNGIMSRVLENHAPTRTIELTNPKFHRLPTSATFHARDIFGPVAAHLANGVALDAFGPAISDLVKIESQKRADEQRVSGDFKGRPRHIARRVRGSRRCGRKTCARYERTQPRITWRARGPRQDHGSVRVNKSCPVEKRLRDPGYESVEEIFHAVAVEHPRGNVEWLMERERKSAHDAPDVFDVNAVNERQRVQQHRHDALIDELERQFVNCASITALQNVNADEVTTDVPDRRGESAECAGPIR